MGLQFQPLSEIWQPAYPHMEAPLVGGICLQDVGRGLGWLPERLNKHNLFSPADCEQLGRAVEEVQSWA